MERVKERIRALPQEVYHPRSFGRENRNKEMNKTAVTSYGKTQTNFLPNPVTQGNSPRLEKLSRPAACPPQRRREEPHQATCFSNLRTLGTGRRASEHPEERASTKGPEPEPLRAFLMTGLRARPWIAAFTAPEKVTSRLQFCTQPRC